MATYTDNFSLALPGYGEDADVGVLNDNTEEIDGYMHDSMMISLSMYDATKTYNTDDVVGHQNPSTHRIRAYKCLADNVTGAWDSTKWELTNIAEELGQAGASSLSDLDDVEITSPSEGQILTYDGDDWVNADAPDVDVTKTASGNPIEVSDSANAPLVKCVSAIQGSQDLHGYDKPWVGGAGKNLALIAESTKFNSQACTIDYKNNGVEITATGNYGRSGYSFTVQSGTKYTISFWAYGNAYNQIYFHDANVWTTGYGTLEITSTRTKYTKTITSDSNILFVGFYCTAVETSGSMVIEDFMVEAGEQATAFAPYSNICPITAYDESTISVEDENEVVQQTSTATFSTAIYQGNADFVGESVTGEWICDNMGDYTWGAYQSDKWYSADIENIVDITHRGDAICSQYKCVTTHPTLLNDGEFVIHTNGLLYIRDDNFAGMTASQVKTMLNGVQIAYPVATPTTETITPTNLPIKSLFGYNHIESSTGDMEVEYITKNFQPLLDLMKKMVVANPSADATETLEKLKVDDTVYSLPSGGGGIPSIGATVNTFSLS